MNLLLELLVFSFVPILIGIGIRTFFWEPRRQEPFVYECQELVQDTEMAVTYRDSSSRPCNNGCRLFVNGVCTPICPTHQRPMTRVK